MFVSILLWVHMNKCDSVTLSWWPKEGFSHSVVVVCGAAVGRDFSVGRETDGRTTPTQITDY